MPPTSFDPSSRMRAQSGSSRTARLWLSVVGVPPFVWPQPAPAVGAPITAAALLSCRTAANSSAAEPVFESTSTSNGPCHTASSKSYSAGLKTSDPQPFALSAAASA